MRAIRQSEFGGPEQLRYTSVDDPVVQPGGVIIQVLAAGVHSLDTTIRQGQAGGPMALPTLPMTPGREAAGEVIKIADDVDPDWLGALVVAHLGMASGGYAEQVATQAASLHRLPDDLDPAAAIALIGSGRTALAIFDAGDVQEEDVLLIPGASGGLGNLLVQFGIALGARVIALAGGAEKVARLSGLQAEVIDYAAPGWEEALAAAIGETAPSVLLDGVGGTVAGVLLDTLGPLARVVPFGWSSGTPLAFSTMDIMAKGLTVRSAVGPTVMSRPGFLRELEERALAAGSAGHVRPLVQAFPLERADDAHRAIEDRTSIGKVVLLPTPTSHPDTPFDGVSAQK